MRAAILLALLAGMAPAAAGAAPPLAASPRPSDALLREHLWGRFLALPPGQRPKIGLALSGGGVRGLAHVGVLQALSDAAFPIDVVAGASMGAIVGAFYAAGLGTESLWELPRQATLSGASNLNKVRMIRLLLKDSLLSTEKMERVLSERLGDMRFDELRKPFACVAMDIRTGESVVFREGAIAPAVRASMNLPGIFKPVGYRHRYLVDGGVVDYIPIDVARLLGADWILASVTEGDFSKSRPTNVLMTLSQVIDIRGALLAQQQKRQANFVIAPKVGDVNMLEFERVNEVLEAGVTAGKRGVVSAQEALLLHALPKLLGKDAR